MAHGTPDWSGKILQSTFAIAEDLAELAARLGSLSTWDRRGKVLWGDDFNRGKEAWNTYAYGTGASVAVSTSYPKLPPFCCKLTGGTTATGVVGIRNYFGLIAVGKLGLECSVAFLTAFDYFRLLLEVYDGANWHGSGLQISDTDDTLSYRDENGIYQELASLADLVATTGRYHSLKLVVDFTNDLGVRAKLNGTGYDLSSYALPSVADVTEPYLEAHLFLKPRSGQNDVCHVDGVILTQDEE